MARIFSFGLLAALGIGAATAIIPDMMREASADVIYSQDFNSPNALQGMIVINSNNDFKEWSLKDGCAWLQYNGQEASDDWLLTPALSLSAGNIYKIKFEAWAHIGNQYPERFELKCGTTPTAEGMTIQLLEPTDLTNKEGERQLFECAFTPEADGTYYFGFHGISDADMSALFLDNIVITKAVQTVPSAPTDLTVAGDPMGTNKAEISFKAPTTDMTGAPLTSMSKIELLREDVLIHTFENPQPGEELSYTDMSPIRGLITYHVVPYSNEGAGMEAFLTAFIGVNTPAPCPSVTVVESSSKPGLVTVSWEAPTVDVDGNPINQDLITYEVVERNGYWSQQVIKSDIRGTSYTYQAVPVGEPQEFKQWGVYAYTANGTKHDTRTGTLAVGTPYDTPYYESFADGTPATIVSFDSELDAGSWTYYTDETGNGIHAQDGDNGFVGIFTSDTETPSVLALGKVNLDCVNPGLSFYLYNPIGYMGANLDTLDVEVYFGDKWESIYSVTLEDLALQDDWNRIMLSLEEMPLTTAQFRFVGRIVNGGAILIDNIRIGELYNYNIGATAISSPAYVKPDTDFNIDVTVENFGMCDASGYEVTLLRNGQEVGTLPGEAIEPCEAYVVSFTDRVNVAADDVISYQAYVTWADDQDPSDNMSRKCSSQLQRSLLPSPDYLTAQENKGTVTLTWNEPDMETSEGATVTESFELAESWAIDNVEGWTFIDGDGAQTYSLQAFTYPGKNAPMAYQVFDRASQPFTTESGFDAASGVKFLASFCSASGKNDDWAISPRLSGNAQTISLQASSFAAAQGYEYLETFEILYSNSGTEVEDFTLLTTVKNVPTQWTRYTFNLPEGARYFAIRCISEDKFIFMVDDVTYEPDVIGAGLELLGYNIYRDEIRLNQTPVTSTSYVDENVPAGDYTYVVSAVYDKGESGISNLVFVSTQGSGVRAIATSQFGVSVHDGKILYNGEGRADVYDMQGRLVMSLANGSQTSLPTGMYIVTANGQSAKIRL